MAANSQYDEIDPISGGQQAQDPFKADPSARQAQAIAGPGGGGSPIDFVSFDRYFNTNAPSAQNMANTATDQVAKQAQNARAAVNDYAQDLHDQVYGGVNGNQYSGPTSTDDGSGAYGGVQQQVGDANSALGQLGSYAGIGNYLKQNSNTNASYTAGMNRFDAALAGQAGGQEFSQLRNYYGDLGDSMNRLGQQANSWITDAHNQAASYVAPQAPTTTPDSAPNRPPGPDLSDPSQRRVFDYNQQARRRIGQGNTYQEL